MDGKWEGIRRGGIEETRTEEEEGEVSGEENQLKHKISRDNFDTRN